MEVVVSLITVTLDTDLAVLLQELNQPIQEMAREMIILELYGIPQPSLAHSIRDARNRAEY